jgi:hypothetical protein
LGGIGDDDMANNTNSPPFTMRGVKGRGKEGSRGFVMIGRVGGAGWPTNGSVCET